MRRREIEASEIVVGDAGKRGEREGRKERDRGCAWAPAHLNAGAEQRHYAAAQCGVQAPIHASFSFRDGKLHLGMASFILVQRWQLRFVIG